MNNLIEEKFQSKLTVVAWIKCHVGEIEINSSDLHYQQTLSSITPDILGLFVQFNEDRTKIDTFDIYTLTMQGSKKFQIHKECIKKSFSKFFMDNVKFIDGPLEVMHDIFEVLQDDPMEVSSNDIQANESDMNEESETNEDDFWKICQGCNRTFEDSNKFCMHISHYKCKCKNSYGKNLEKWMKERKTFQNRMKKKKHYVNHKDEISQRKKEYYKAKKCGKERK